VRACQAGRVDVVGEPTDYMAAVWAEMDSALEPWPPPAPPRTWRRRIRDRRGMGLAGTIAAVAATGERVLVVCADAARRHAALAPRLGGFALCSYACIERDQTLVERYDHLVALDPPAHAHHQQMLDCGRGFTHLAWGEAELRFAQQVHELEYGLRDSLVALYRDARDAGKAQGEALEELLRGHGRHPRSPALSGRLLRVLVELGLVLVDRDTASLEVPAAQRTALERSEAFRAYKTRHEDGIRFLTTATARAA
jgi:single-stranded-DNA-specific exonuclease